MKKGLLLILMVFVFGVGAALAEGEMSVDVSGSYASEPVTGFGSTIGFGIGGNYGISKELAGRVDLNYYSWKYDYSDFWGSYSSTYTRMPIFAGARYLIPMDNTMNAYVEGGVELSFDSFEIAWGGFKTTGSETKFGITPGAGIEYSINPNIYVGANARYHIVTNPYLTAGVNVGYRFGK